MPQVFIPTDDGRWVNADFERLARIVQDYDSELELRWIPPDKRTREDKKPFIVVDKRTETAVLHASEFDSPVEILTRLFLGDGTKNNTLADIEAHNRAVEAMNMKHWLDEREDLMDQANFLVGSPINTVRFNGKKLDHLRRPIL